MGILGCPLFTLAHFCAFHSLVGLFPILFISFYYRWHPHHWACFIYISKFSSFFVLIRFDRPCGSTFQVCCLILSLGLPLNFSPPLSFYTFVRGIRVLGVPLGSLSFTSFFFHEALDDDIQHIDALHELRDLGFLLFHLEAWLPFSLFPPLHKVS